MRIKQSLSTQMVDSLYKCFGKNKEGGFNKYSLQTTKEQQPWMIYSRSELNRLKDVAKQLTKFIKEYYPDTKRYIDIQERMVQAFVDNKATSCNDKTLYGVKQSLKKLNNCCNHRCNSNRNWDSIQIPKTTISEDRVRARNIAMSREDYNKILEYKSASTSESYIGFKIAGALGLRITALVNLKYKDIDLQRNKVFVEGDKGNKSYYVDIFRERDREMLREILNRGKELGRYANSRIVEIKPDSYDRFVSRACYDLGLDKYPNNSTSQHAIRKMVAQERYNAYRENHTKEETVAYVNTQLGHNITRGESYLATYVANIY